MHFDKKFKIGIYINQNSLAGGGFYESLSTIKNFKTQKFDVNYFTSSENCFYQLKEERLNAFFININIFDRFILYFRRFLLLKAASITPGNITPVKLLKKFLPKFNRFEKKFIKNNINIVYFISPDVNCVYLENLQFIITVWDLAHNNIAHFPELRENNVFETRENYYQNILPKAYGIVIGHELTKELLIRKYAQNSEKIFTVPFKASPKIIEQEDKTKSVPSLKFLNLPKKYLYYPSQYAAHKNHRILIDAIEYLDKKKYKDFGLVFSGSDRGNLNFLREIVNKKKLSNKIIFMPFISDEEVFSVFKNSFALAMPSYLGPGTLPTMEAMYIGTPLILPNFEFNKAFYCDSSLYYDAFDFESLANLIIKLDNQIYNRNELIIKAKNKYESIMMSNESNKLIKHIEKLSLMMYSYQNLV